MIKLDKLMNINKSLNWFNRIFKKLELNHHNYNKIMDKSIQRYLLRYLKY